MVALLRILVLALYSVLPASPFRQLADSVADIEFLPYLNWFIPFDQCAKFTGLWCAALLVFYNFRLIKGLVDKVKNALWGG